MRITSKKRYHLFTPGKRCWVLLTAVALSLALTGCFRSGVDALQESDRLIQEGEYQAALEPLKVAVQSLPKTPQTWNYLGMALQGGGKLNNAKKAYGKALKLDAKFSAAYYNLGVVYLELKDFQRALLALKRFTEQKPNDPNGWLKMGSAHLQSRNFSEAEDCFKRVIRLTLQHPQASNGLGVIRLYQGSAEDAETQFLDALNIKSDYAPALLNLAIVYHKYLKRPRWAIAKYREYLELTPRPANYEAVQKTLEKLEAENPTAGAVMPLPELDSEPKPQKVAQRSTNALPEKSLELTSRSTPSNASEQTTASTELKKKYRGHGQSWPEPQTAG